MDSPQSIAAAFAVGLFGTMHCIGMCGGIIGALSMSLPEQVRANRPWLLTYIGAYNLGRIISYAIAGFAVGYIGSAAAGYTDMSDGPSLLRHTGAVMMIAIGLYLAGWFPQLSIVERLGQPIWKRLEPVGRKLIPVSSLPKALLYGLIWGWLPCGMVYFVLVWALTAGSAIDGALTMAAFGLGTLPSLMAAGLAASWLQRITRSKIARQIVGATVILMAVATLVMQTSGHGHMNHANMAQQDGMSGHTMHTPGGEMP
jgi:sulfite exporter TauE/SafE